MSIVSDAIALWRECRADFELHRMSEHERAAEACRDRLLNRRGMRAGIDSMSLFIGNRAHAYAYASEELIEHWTRWPRPVYEDFERQWIQTKEAERGY